MENFNVSVNQIKSEDTIVFVKSRSMISWTAYSFPHWLEMPVGFSVLFPWSVCLIWHQYFTAAVTIGLKYICSYLIWQASGNALIQSFFFPQISLCISSHLFIQINVRFILSTSTQKLNWDFDCSYGKFGEFEEDWHLYNVKSSYLKPNMALYLFELFSKVWKLFFMRFRTFPVKILSSYFYFSAILWMQLLFPL